MPVKISKIEKQNKNYTCNDNIEKINQSRLVGVLAPGLLKQ